MPLLTPENYQKGFLIDEELMGGVSTDPDQPGQFLAFVLCHTTGESLGNRSFTSLDEALQAINLVERAWKFEKTSGCGTGDGPCAAEGKCGTGACPGVCDQSQGC